MDARELLGGDTIVAIATPPGEGGIGVVRLSGKDSFSVAGKIIRLKDKKKYSKKDFCRMMFCRFMDPHSKAAVDEGFVVFMKAPRSYTGQDVVELHAHGSPVVLRKIVELCVRHGARCAPPGEFTKRAFLSGRMDLSQAEAVLDVIQAKNEKALRAAGSVLSGKLRVKILSFKEKLLYLLARVEVIFDYPEEGVEEISGEELGRELQFLRNEAVKLCSTYEEGRKIKEGFKTVFAGKPNSGKSSLLNALVQQDRAIVTDIPGTTRDTLEADIHLQGIPVTFVDTAGLRKNPDHAVEKLGISRTCASLKEADIVLAVFDLSAPFSRDDENVLHEVSGKHVLVVLNKSDLKRKLDVEKIRAFLKKGSFVETSAVTGGGLENLKEKMISFIEHSVPRMDGEELVLTNLRHKNALEKSAAHMDEALKNARDKMPMDVLTVDMRASLEALNGITGESAPPDVLSEIFSRFCVGK